MKVADILETMDYGPALESRGEADAWLAKHKKKFGVYVNGKWTKSKSGKFLDTSDPCTNTVLAKISRSGKSDVNNAVSAARKALPNWKKLGDHGRARYMYALARQIQKNARLFAVLESLDNGKPIRETRDIDIPLVARHFYYHAGWAQMKSSELPNFKEVGVFIDL